MFPTIGDLISYLFHISVKINLQTFGTLMALAFAGAYVVFTAEFKRKEGDGTIGMIGKEGDGMIVKEKVGEPGFLVEQSSSLAEQPRSLMEQASSLVEQPHSLVEQPSSLVGEPGSLVEQPRSLVEQPSSLVEHPVSPVILSVSTLELLLNTALGFLFGYKVIDVLLALFQGADPAPGFLSLHGNILAGCLFALIWGGWVYKDRRLSAPKEPHTHPYQLMPYITFMVACWGFLGAKLFDAVEHFQELRYEPLKVLLARSGFTYYGGLIFGALTCLYIAYKNKIRLIHMADIGSPGMMLAYGIGRIGCQLSGDGDWGIVNRHVKPGWIPQWAWASTYPHNAIDAGVYMPACNCYQLPLGVYPTPLYEAVICILLFAGMWIIRKRLKTPGAMFCLFLILNGTERFLIEYLRITPKYFLHLSQAQMIALLFITGGLAGFVSLTSRSYFSALKTT
jgi:phosphatidylglycerol:prolipoprotein diacylglycerol transferase